jgi:hypothetical protein
VHLGERLQCSFTFLRVCCISSSCLVGELTSTVTATQFATRWPSFTKRSLQLMERPRGIGVCRLSAAAQVSHLATRGCSLDATYTMPRTALLPITQLGDGNRWIAGPVYWRICLNILTDTAYKRVEYIVLNIMMFVLLFQKEVCQPSSKRQKKPLHNSSLIGIYMLIHSWTRMRSNLLTSPPAWLPTAQLKHSQRMAGISDNLRVKLFSYDGV